MENNYYVYQYNRQDGTPYYIGKGKGKRAWFKHRRVKPPTDPSKIIIVSKDCTEQEAYQIEEYLIAYYGRIDKGTGILRNMTDGGDAPPSWKGKKRGPWSEEHRRKNSEAKKGKKHTEERIAKKLKPVLQYTLEGIFVKEYPSVKEAKRQADGSPGITECLRGRNKKAGGYLWKYKN